MGVILAIFLHCFGVAQVSGNNHAMQSELGFNEHIIVSLLSLLISWTAAWSRPREAWPKTTLASDSCADSCACFSNCLSMGRLNQRLGACSTTILHMVLTLPV